MTSMDRAYLDLWQTTQRMLEGVASDLTSAPKSTLWVGDWGTVSPPRIEVEELDRSLIVTICVPNVAPEDIEIQISPETLLIQAEQREMAEVEGHCHTSFPVGCFQSLLPLPCRIYPDILKADLQDDTLTLHLAKSGTVPRHVFQFNLADSLSNVNACDVNACDVSTCSISSIM